MLAGIDKPLDSPLHGHVADDQRRGEVENLMAESSPGVENSCVKSTGERSLSVGTECEGCDTLLCLGACVLLSVNMHFPRSWIPEVRISTRYAIGLVHRGADASGQ